MTPLVIYASELSSCVGLNRYKPLSEVASRVWMRSDPEGHFNARQKFSVEEKKPIELTLQEVDLTNSVNKLISTETKNLYSDIDSLVLSLKDLLTEDLASDIKSFVLTERGKNFEESSLNKMEIKMETKIIDRNAKFYKKYIEYESDMGEKRKLLLGGRIDGITEEGTLVEMKNRQNRIFKDIPMYEKVQVHAYMFLTGIQECKLVQCYNDEDSTSVITFDKDFWEYVLNRLRIFAQCLDKTIHDENKQESLLKFGMLDIEF